MTSWKTSEFSSVCASLRDRASYSFLFVFKYLSRFLPVATLLDALPLVVTLFNLLEEAVGASPPGQNLAGRLLIQENW